jgi:tetratricopeptide (TPR) repeat protein
MVSPHPMNVATPVPNALPSPIAREVRRLRALQARGDHAEALAEARARLADAPDNRDLRLIEASALRHLGRTVESLASLDRLIELHPRFSLLHQERGLCHVARKDAPAAIAALLRAVNLNPALPMSWRMLEGVYRLVGRARDADTAASHVATLRALPGEIVQATSLYADGDLDAAEAMIRAFLIAHGDHPEGMRLLAKIGLAHKVYDDAELLLAGVLAMVPDHRAARYEYAQALTFRQKYVKAHEALAPLLASDPANIDFRTLSSTIAVGLGRQDEAIALYRAMLADLDAASAPANPLDAENAAQVRADLNLWLGHALKTIGALPESIAAYRAAAAARPNFGDAYWSLANLKTYRFVEAEIAAAQAAEAEPATSTTDRIHLCFALGKAYEDRSDYAAAWAYYACGNALQRAESSYRPELIEANTRNQIAVCTRDFFRARSGWGCAEPDPIFIVGLPRSGSTLIEQILSSHTQVEGTQELAEIHRYVVELQGRNPDLDHPLYPGVLADLTREDFAALGRRYLEETRVYRSGAPRFIDKMPNNFRHIGLIHLMLPNAVIIDARREPMACCFSNLKQLFAHGQEFSYGVDDIARYYRTYLELMRHWDVALPGRVLRVQHEDVIDDLDGSVRRILNHCGLAFEPSCVAYHQTRRAVRTPSSEQVRRPIFREGLDQWRAFEKQLAPLSEALGDAREHHNY